MQPYPPSRRTITNRFGRPRPRPATAEPNEDEINVLQLCQDAYYFMGFTQLAKYTVFLMMGIVMLLFHVSTMNNTANTAYFRTSVTNQLATSFDLDNQDLPTWQNVNSFYDAAVYYKSFLGAAINKSSDMQLPPDNVTIGEYGNVSYARIIVNFKENCLLKHIKHNQDRCLTYAPQEVQDLFRYNAAQHVKRASRNTTEWHVSPAKFYKFRSAAKASTDWQALVVISHDPTTNRTTYADKLANKFSDAHLAGVAKYAYSVGLDIIASNTLSDDDYAIFSLRAQRSSGGRGIDTEAFQRLSITTPGKRYIYSSRKDGLRKIVEVVFWLAFFWLIALDYAQWLLAHRQGCTLGRYLRTPWNLYCWLANLALLLWLVYYLVLFGAWSWSHNNTYWPKYPASCNDFYRYEFYPAYYTMWVYWGVAMVLLIGIRMLQFTRLHTGLNVFHDVFVKTMRDLADFFAVFIFIICLFGTCVYMIFQVSGGNANWITWTDGASVLSRLAFQAADYQDVYNNGIGAGRYGWVITAIFWLSIAALLVWSGNIFLSAVSYAYGAVRDRNPQVEVFFLWEVLLRFFTFFAYLYWMAIGSYLHRRRHRDRDDARLVPSPQVSPTPSNLSTSSRLPFASHPSSSPPPALPPPPGRQSPPRRSVAFEVSVRVDGSGTMQEGLMPANGGPGADGLPRSRSRGVISHDTLTGPLQAGRKFWEGARDWWHHTDIRFYELFLVDSPQQHPRWYMLSRWAVASRPEMRALAVYFTDFRRFHLPKPEPLTDPASQPTDAPQAFSTDQSGDATSGSVMDLGASTDTLGGASDPPGRPPVMLRHIRAKNEQPPVEAWIAQGVPEFITTAKLQQLLAEVQLCHKDTLNSVRLWLFPMRLTKYLLGYFWKDKLHHSILVAVKKVYNPRFMKEIESSFAIDEDEEGAIPTLRDLQSRVQDPMQTLTRRAEEAEERLQRIEKLLMTLLAKGTSSLQQSMATPPGAGAGAAAAAASEAAEQDTGRGAADQ